MSNVTPLNVPKRRVLSPRSSRHDRYDLTRILIDEVLHIIEGEPIARIAFRSGVSDTTLRRLRDGLTKAPQVSTLLIILKAYGYSLAVVRDA